MPVACWLALSLLTLLAAPSGAAPTIAWHDGLEFELEGKGWTQTTGPYDRLPASAQGRINETAWGLAKNSAGMAIRFATDAPTVQVRWAVTSAELAMPHMPATGVSGVDLYVRTKAGTWVFVGNGRPGAGREFATSFDFVDGPPRLRECLLYLPLYNGTRSVQVGVPEGARIERAAPRPANRRGAVLVYGTSIAQGGCASRPGMAWTAILGRLLDRPMINLAFSGSGTMEAPVGDVLAEVDADVYVIDCIWNIGDIPESEYAGRVSALVSSIRKAHPSTPILFVGQSHIRPEAHPTVATRRQARAVAELTAHGVPGVTTAPAEALMGSDGDGTVDGVHPNDLGMYRQAHALFPVVRKLLK